MWNPNVFIFSFLFVLLASNLSAIGTGEGLVKDGKVKGIIVDNVSNEPVEYASVALYKLDSDELITGTISDFSGQFKIDDLQIGSYYLVISFIGYTDLKTDIFKIDGENRSVNLGNIYLTSLAKELEEFDVVGDQAAIEYRIDKKIINVSKQITAEAGSAIDVLENVPSIQVDVEGNVTLRGSSGFMVLIDGKPSLLDPNDVLRQIPSNSIENIEIITNPSVKFDPDGATGIINIILKKSRMEGVSGIANANVGRFGQYGGDFQLNYRVNKLNFVFGANYNKRSRPSYVTNNRITTENDTIGYIDAKGDSERDRSTASVNLGIEYSISENDFLTVSGALGYWDMTNYSDLTYDNYTVPENLDLSYYSNDEVIRKGDFYNADAVYQHNFGKKKPKNLQPDSTQAKAVGKGERKGFKSRIDHSLKFEVLYRYRNIDESSINEISTLSNEILGSTKNLENGPSESWRFNLDYTLPVNKTDKFEAGLRLRTGRNSDMTELYLYNDISGEVELIPEFSNNTDYHRNISSAYALYAGEVKKFGYQVGLRTEYTDRKIETLNQSPFILDRWDLFPTLHISYNLEKEQQIMLSYTRRIDRPRSYWLEPFFTWQDAYNVRQGNPALNPEYIDSFDFGYVKKFGSNFLSLEGYYRITNNKVERVQSIYTENVLLTRPENIGKDFSLGLEAMLSLELTKWWDMEFSANLFNYRLDGELTYIDNETEVTEVLDRSNTTWNSRFNNIFKVWKNGVFQLNSRYNSKSISAQGTRKGYYTLDAAFKVTFFKKSLSANLQGRNLLGTAVRESKVEGLGFTSFYKFEPRFPIINLSISYRFNNFKQNRRSNQDSGSSGDDF